MGLSDRRQERFPWGGYALAAAITTTLILFRLEVGQLTGTRVSLPLCGLAAVFACIWKADLGPALFATALTTAWYISDSGISGAGAWLHYAFYVAEAGAFCYYGRQLRIARDLAARGADWQRHLVETAGEGIWTVGPDGIIDNANPRIAEILGCRVNQITGRKVEYFLFPEDIPSERIRFQNRRPGVKEQYDRRLRRADGSEVWTLASTSPFSYRECDAGVLTMMTDITERKQAEHALRRSERKFRELFENVCEGVYQTSLDGRILAANPELLRMLGFSSEDELNVPGVVKDTFVDPELHLNLRDRLERDGSYTNVEFQLRTRDHRVITVSENARVVRDETGDILYFEGTLADITGKLLMEQQLRDAQKMEALGRLAGGIARDFRAIGNGMAADFQHALDSLPPDSLARAPLESVAKSMRSAQALTRQILDFSRRQTQSVGRSGQDRVVTDFNILLLNLETSLRRAAGTDLELFLCSEPAPVLADSGQMNQILTSLLIHVRDSGPQAKPIALTTAIRPGELSLSVWAAMDSGNGVSHPWIGISTCQAILAQYGGVVNPIENRDAIQYEICLPVATESQMSRQLPDSPRVAVVTVLLVDAEPLKRELSRDMLESQGFRVLTASNASDAERIARSGQAVDLLICDRATDAQGASVVHRLRETRPALKVLFIAGYADGSPGSGPLPEGAAQLQKPFSGDSLERKIRELLTR